jgi:hypothetical protein
VSTARDRATAVAVAQPSSSSAPENNRTDRRNKRPAEDASEANVNGQPPAKRSRTARK